jgi:hypothetical protein
LGGRGRWISEFEDSQGYTEKPCLKKLRERGGGEGGRERERERERETDYMKSLFLAGICGSQQFLVLCACICIDPAVLL